VKLHYAKDNKIHRLRAPIYWSSSQQIFPVPPGSWDLDPAELSVCGAFSKKCFVHLQSSETLIIWSAKETNHMVNSPHRGLVEFFSTNSLRNMIWRLRDCLGR